MSIKNFPVLAVTCGEPAGIGPEIALRATWEMRDKVQSVLIGDFAQLAEHASILHPAMMLTAYDAAIPPATPDCLPIIHCPLSVPAIAGKLDKRNAQAVLRMLDVAIDGTLQRRFDAMVTAPLQKSVINAAGIPFTGHTEYLASRTGTRQVVMMLATHATPRPLRVALATTHLALKEVPAAMTVESLSSILDILHADLRHKFGIAKPRILVAGLNPHAGEGGYLGREEMEVIAPVLAAAAAKGMDVKGPYPADTLFLPHHLDVADCVLAMYHDQGLPVLKYASFGLGVNITLGLPIIRTSVDHGTALDIAASGLGKANHASMVEAIRIAAQMVQSAQVVS